jgi:1-acyl-sn-glycerol-3-phosphate acyltransferase
VKWLADIYLRLRGWRFLGRLPDLPKMVIVGAPHTSNWDFVLFLAALRQYDMRVSFIGKHTLFRWPLGFWFRRWGGIPVDRSVPGGLVRQVASAFDEAERMILVMAPEGTRKLAPYWKAGFIWIAEEADVPVVLAGVDGKSRTVEIGPTVPYHGDPAGFMEQLRNYYSAKSGFKPEGKGPVRVKEEIRSS